MTNDTFINSNQLIQLLSVSKDTAQNMLTDIQKVLGKQEDEPISVKEFCLVFRLDERHVLKAIPFM